MTSLDWFPHRPQLRPGLRVVRRDDGHQVGRWPGERLLLPRDPLASRFLDDLVDGRRPDLSTPAARRWARLLVERGLLVDDAAQARRAARRTVLVAVDGSGAYACEAQQLLDDLDLRRAGKRPADVVVVVRPTGEVARGATDSWLRDGVAHLPVTSVAGRVTVGPFVAPGLTACLRCVDAHGSDVDPGHGLVVEQHVDEDAEPPDPALMHLALAWAVRDVAAYAEGDLPSTWSASVVVDGRLVPERTAYLRHPRCGCSWFEALASTASA